MTANTETLDPSIDDESDTDEQSSGTDISGGALTDGVVDTGHHGKVGRPGRRWDHVAAFAILPAVILVLAGVAGFLFYKNHSATAADRARIESVQAATESTIALLSYQPDSVDKTLDQAQSRLTGVFKDSYSKLVHDVVITGAKQKHISSVATVPAAAPLSASAEHAVVLVYVNQNVIIGTDAPTSSTSCVRIALDKVDNRWLIAQFDPI